MRYIWNSILLIYTISSYSQNNSLDSLSSLDYKILYQKVYEKSKDSVNSTLFANAYLEKARKLKDTLKIATGYHILSSIGNNKSKLKYLDSIILISQGKNFKAYPLVAYYVKGVLYYEKRNFKLSSNNFIKARKINRTGDFDEDTDMDIDYMIGLIESRLGHYNKALKLFKKTTKHYKNNGDDSYYLGSLFAIDDTFRHLKNIDSSDFYNKLGYQSSLRFMNEKYISFFSLNSGANLYYRGKFENSLTKLESILPQLLETKDIPNIAMGYYFIGMNYIALKNQNLGLKNLLRLDSLYVKTKDLHPELRKTYEVLIDNYRSKGDVKEELKYVNRLLEIDKLLSNNYKYLSEKITVEYDTPNLLNKKEELIKQVRRSNKNYITIIILSCFLLITSTIYFLLRQRRHKRYKKSFELLLEKEALKKSNTIKKQNSYAEIGIKDEKIDKILLQLKVFEEKKRFLKKDITVNQLAKEMSTNSKYLSKVINIKKEKTFVNYINELRIGYAIMKLKDDIVFRKYTIKAISEECGFKTAESFSNTFYKHTGIKPSYFITNIEK